MMPTENRAKVNSPAIGRSASAAWAEVWMFVMPCAFTIGDEAIHCILDAMYAKAPYTVLRRAMHIHPTIAEFIPSILDDLTPLR